MENLEQENIGRLKNLIENSSFVRDASTLEGAEADEVIKKFFKLLSQSLSEYDEKRYDRIENKILGAKKAAVPAVFIALIRDSDKTENSYKNFFPILHDDDFEFFSPAGTLAHVFVAEDYDVLRNVMGDFSQEKCFTGSYEYNGEKKDFSYRLKYDDSYLKAQKIFSRLSAVYKNDTPVLYNPFATKFFKVVSQDALPEKLKYKDIDFAFERNNLKVIEDAKLYWNIEVAGRDSEFISPDRVAPYGNEKKYTYRISNKRKEKLFLLPFGNQALIYDCSFSEECSEMDLNLEVAAFQKFFFHDVDMDTPEFRGLNRRSEVFSNDFVSPLRKDRLLSMADVEYAIRPFRVYRNVSCRIALEEPETKLLRYENKLLKYRQVFIRPLRTVYLLFETNEDSEESVKYVCDYANFVMSYLQYFYPEIDWVGGM